MADQIVGVLLNAHQFAAFTQAADARGMQLADYLTLLAHEAENGGNRVTSEKPEV